MPRARQKPTKNQPRPAPKAPKAPLALPQPMMPLDDGTLTTPVTLAMIQALIALGLRAVEEALLAEVQTLAGPRYARDDPRSTVVRWGAQRGSIYLADQKLPITVPRVRDGDGQARREVPLATYAALQTPRAQDVGLFRRVLGGLSCREYEAAAEAVPDEAFGLARSTVSRRFIRASARKLRLLQERRLDDAEWLVLVLDGKAFAGDQLVVALGVTATGEKRILGLVQTASENKLVIASVLRELGERGFPLAQPLLVVLDGAKGLRATVRDVFGDRVQVQRCQWHKRENVVSYLAKQDHLLQSERDCYVTRGCGVSTSTARSSRSVRGRSLLRRPATNRHDGPRLHLDDVEYATRGWEAWYNSQRLLKPLDFSAPAEYEAQRCTAQTALAGVRRLD